jgi:hypothetical protein
MGRLRAQRDETRNEHIVIFTGGEAGAGVKVH